MVAAKIIHNEYKDVLLNKKRFIHSVNKILSKNHTIGTHETNQIYLYCFAKFIFLIMESMHQLLVTRLDYKVSNIKQWLF